jgi:hypothetical protein
MRAIHAMFRQELSKLPQLVLMIVLIVASALLMPSAASDKEPTVIVRRPTVVAFFPPASKAEFESDSDANEALADFRLYAAQVRKPLQDAGIDFHEIFAHSFRVQRGSKAELFRPGKVNVGYYFVAPKTKARVEYGVMTSGDVLQTAREYFGAAANGLPPAPVR